MKVSLFSPRLLWASALVLLLCRTPHVPFVAAAADDEAAAAPAAAVQVEFEVQLAPGKTGSFIVEVHPDWAPLGAARFLELVHVGDDFWKGIRFFRVIEGFMAQFGIPAKPADALALRERKRRRYHCNQSEKQSFHLYHPTTGSY